MKKYRIKAFGITKEILGGRELSLELGATTVGALRAELYQRHPNLQTLRSMMVAVNNNYAEDEQSISENDEIALIPPVSGG